MNEKNRDKPTYANDVDGLQAPSIETTPGTIPQTPVPDRAPSRPQGGSNSEVGTDNKSADDPTTGRPSQVPRP